MILSSGDQMATISGDAYRWASTFSTARLLTRSIVPARARRRKSRLPARTPGGQDLAMTSATLSRAAPTADPAPRQQDARLVGASPTTVTGALLAGLLAGYGIAMPVGAVATYLVTPDRQDLRPGGRGRGARGGQRRRALCAGRGGRRRRPDRADLQDRRAAALGVGGRAAGAGRPDCRGRPSGTTGPANSPRPPMRR